MPASVASRLTPSILFLVLSLLGAGFVINAYHPLVKRGPLSVSTFFAGWLTAELPLQHVAWHVAVTGVFVWLGALGAWPGFLGLAITVGSCIALIRLFAGARRAHEVMERALCEALGNDYTTRIAPERLSPLDAPPALAQILVPFAMGHPDVERTADISYGEHGRRNHLDIYRARAGGSKRPVLIQVHGGAWIIGRKEQQGLPLMVHLALEGWVCVAINYRLSPRATFPDHIVDVKRAILWVKQNIARYGGDPDFVVIAGGSAGGHLAALAALTPDDKSLQPGFEDADTGVQACVPFYGVFDFTDRNGMGRPDLRIILERLIIKKPMKTHREVFEKASPLYRVSEKAPPFMVVHGVNDILAPVAEARHFVNELRAVSKAPVVYAELPVAQHAFEVFASVRAAHVVRGVARFLEYLHCEHVRAGEPLRASPPPPVSAPGAAESAQAI
ncbi:MAG: alpha/beta hydrolase [Polyangiaceae bacterium]|nr:alpha/beta hydrolase [Polyangiaceae bacterium]